LSIGDGDPFGGPYSAMGIGSGFTFAPPDRSPSMAEKYEQMKLLMAQQQSVLSPEQINQMTQAVFNGPPPLTPEPPKPATIETLNQRAREMLLKRIGGIKAEHKIVPGDFLTCHCYADVVHVFYCHNGNSGVTQESIDLFPSDTIITQFRMIFV
jgi:hypothetical protein